MPDTLLQDLILDGCDFIWPLLRDEGSNRIPTHFFDCCGSETCHDIADALESTLRHGGHAVRLLDLGPLPDGRLPGHLRFRDAIDSSWGENHFELHCVDRKLPQLETRHLRVRGSRFDSQAEGLWRSVNFTTLACGCWDVNDRICQALTTSATREPFHLVVCNPDLEDTQVFNILISVLDACLSDDADVASVWFLFDLQSPQLAAAQDLFHDFAEDRMGKHPRAPWPPPSPRHLERALARRMPEAQARDLAIACILKLRERFSLNLTPSDHFVVQHWREVLGEAFLGMLPPEGEPRRPRRRSTLPLPRTDEEFLAAFNTALRAFAIEEMELLVASRKDLFLASGFLQYLYLASLCLSTTRARTDWIFSDRSLVAVLLESHLVAAALLYPALSHDESPLETHIVAEILPLAREAFPEAALQIIVSWAAIAYRFDNGQLLQRIPGFLATWRELAPRFVSHDEVRAFGIVLEAMLVNARPTDAKEEGERVLSELSWWHENIARLARAVPFFLSSLDVDATHLKERLHVEMESGEFGRWELRVRQKFNRASRLGIAITNVAEEYADTGRYEQALSFHRRALSLVRYNASRSDVHEYTVRFNHAAALESMLHAEFLGGLLPADGRARLREYMRIGEGLGNADWRYLQLADGVLGLFFLVPPSEFPQELDALLALAPHEPGPFQKVRVDLCRHLNALERGAPLSPDISTADLLARISESPIIALLLAVSELAEGQPATEAIRAAARAHFTVSKHNLLFSALLARAMEKSLQLPDASPDELFPLLARMRSQCLTAMALGWKSAPRRKAFLESPVLANFLAESSSLPHESQEHLLGTVSRMLTELTSVEELGGFLCLSCMLVHPLAAVEVGFRDDSEGKWTYVACERSSQGNRHLWHSEAPALEWTRREALPGQIFRKHGPRWTAADGEARFFGDDITLRLRPLAASPQTLMEAAARSTAGRIFLAAVSTAKRLCESEAEKRDVVRKSRAFAQSFAKQTLQLSEQLHEQSQNLRESNARLRELDELKTRFLTNLSHELRTPLTVSIGAIDAIRSRRGDARLPALLDVAARAQQQLLGLVNDLLDDARLQANRMDVSPEMVDMAETLEAQAQLFLAEAERLEIELRLDLPGPIVARVDPAHLERICTNLLSNALKFTPRGGTVSLSAGEEEGHEVWLQVEDSGTGMSERELEHLFERFSISKRGQSLEQLGSGLGMSLVHELVRLNGGRIAVKSELGRGTKFTLHFVRGEMRVPPSRHPRKKLPPPAAPDVAHAPDPQRPGCPPVLVVEDSSAIRTLIHALLSDDFDVFFAENGARALELLATRSFDCIISDYMMPVLNGMELLRQVRAGERNPAVPFLLVTARHDEETRTAAFHAGASEFISKPFSCHELLLRVKNLVELERLRREAAHRNLRQALGSLSSEGSVKVEDLLRAMTPAADVIL